MKYLGGKQRLGKKIAPVLHAIWENDENLKLLTAFDTLI